MKFYRALLITLLCLFIPSCNTPLVSKALGAPAQLIKSITGPVVGPLMGR